MSANRSLQLRRETLTELTADDLQYVAGGDITGTCTYGTMCQAAREFAHYSPLIFVTALCEQEA